MLLNTDVLAALQANLGRDLQAFAPELILCGTIVLLLLMRLFANLDRVHLGWVALVMTVAGFGVAWGEWDGCCAPGAGRIEIFSGLLVYDAFTVFLRLFLLAFVALTIWLSLLTGIPDREDSGDFYTLLLGATLGMSLMAMSNHLLMVFISIEMASLPSYALAGYLKGKRQSSEAALKYVVYGGGAAGIMLYGISLLCGKFGTGYIPDLGRVIPLAVADKFDPILLLGLLFLLIGLGFKLAAVPFHFWCPDVFEGAAAEVAAFLSVASKGAALALLSRLVLGFVGPVDLEHPSQLVVYLGAALGVFAAVTATYGNLAAYPQTNLKRLLAYSTIAHAGYMMMGLAPLTRDGVAAVLFYLIAYLFMNLGAFAVVAFLRNQTGSEDLSSFRGLIYRCPVLVVTLAIFLLSLLGMPPLAGFAAKFQIFRILFDAGRSYSAAGADHPALGYLMYALLVIAGVNTVISVVYYVKVLKVMILDKPLDEIEGRPPEPMPVPPAVAFYATALAAMIFVVGIAWDPLAAASAAGVRQLVARGPWPVASHQATRTPAMLGD